MRRLIAFTLVGMLLAAIPAGVLGQDGLSTEQLKRMYDDAVVQLKTAQNSRNDLARDNEKLKARLAQLEGELKQTQADANAVADATFQARAERAAFVEFLHLNPSTGVQWHLFLEKNLLASPDPADLLDHNWPLPCRK